MPETSTANAPITINGRLSAKGSIERLLYRRETDCCEYPKCRKCSVLSTTFKIVASLVKTIRSCCRGSKAGIHVLRVTLTCDFIHDASETLLLAFILLQ